jgi:hypothetical protein
MKHYYKNQFQKCLIGFGILICSFMTVMQQANAQISSATISVSDSSIIAATVQASNPNICSGASTTLSVTGGHLGTGANWYWYQGSCGGTSIGSGSSLLLTSTYTTNSTNAKITRTFFVRAEGLCNTTICKSVTITIYSTPVITPPTNIVACYGDNIPLINIVGTPAGLTYNISGGADVGIPNANGVPAIPAFTATNNTNSTMVRTITIVPLADGCTGSSVTFTVTVLPQIIIPPTIDVTVCNDVPLAIPFTSNVSGTVVYAWTNSVTAIGLGASGTGNISFTTANTSCANLVANIVLTVSLTDAGKTCSAMDDFTITVRPKPDGDLVASAPACEGDPAPLVYDALCGTGPFSLDIGVNVLTPTTNYPGIADNAIIPVPIPPSGSTTYNLMKITDANGCINQ